MFACLHDSVLFKLLNIIYGCNDKIQVNHTDLCIKREYAKIVHGILDYHDALMSCRTFVPVYDPCLRVPTPLAPQMQPST